ncbi:MAG TPA: hypothetical protein VFU01_11500 [Gemmatimonadaceae bacterium]|nr:hypothetical protein [Gemmatimonadaceae bacterium]
MTRRVDGTVAISIAIHVVAGAFLLWVLSIPYPLRELLERTRPRVEPERISFVSIPNRGETTSGRSGGDGIPERENAPRQPAPPLVAPSATPSSIPTPPAATPREDVGGSGPLVGRGGPVRGIVPSYSDARVWTDPNAPILALPRNISDQLDSMLVSGTQRVRDSIELANAQRRPGDWSWTKDGKKYGWDSLGIHLGGITIPREVLALGGALANVGAASNPTVADRARAVRAMTADINYHAPRAMNAEEFRTAVKRIRERKERERRQAREAAEKKAKEQKIAAP